MFSPVHLFCVVECCCVCKKREITDGKGHTAVAGKRGSDTRGAFSPVLLKGKVYPKNIFCVVTLMLCVVKHVFH